MLMKLLMNELEIIWEGPFAWPLTKEQRVRFPNFAGIYLWTVPYVYGGYVVYLAGITRRPLHKRFGEHSRNHQNGIYTLFDMDEMQRGNRKELWHGFWTKKRTTAQQQDFRSTKRRATKNGSGSNVYVPNIRCKV